ncbi:hypothetical protein D3C76_629900 [compost metagenome]
MAPPGDDLAAVGNGSQLFKLHPRLRAGTQDANGVDLGRRQQPGRDTPGQGCAHAGQPAFVLQQSQRLPGKRAQHQHQAVVARQALGRVVIEAGRELYGEGGAAFYIG